MKIIIILVLLLVSLNSVFSIESKEVLRARLAVRKNMLRGEIQEDKVGVQSESPSTNEKSVDPKIELISLNVQGVSCNDPKQTDYRGKISRTSSGYVCQKWSSKFPQVHNVSEEKYPNSALDRNYCRNPTPETHNKAWCFTTDLEKRWDYCDVNCDQPDPIPRHSKCVDKYQRDYRGKVSHTKSGKLCQRWDVQYPHANMYNKPSQHLFSDLQNNYCRNPGVGKAAAWCYTTDPKTEWEFCDVDCLEHEVVPQNHVQCTHPHQADYRGFVSVTKSGRVCQKWSEQSPQAHSFTPEKFPDDDLNHNYCRNPLSRSGEFTGAWCFTNDPNVRWEYCDVDCKRVDVKPKISMCADPSQKDYREGVSVTKSGKTCQRWDVQYPHKHFYTPFAFPLSGLKGNNFCRNPGQGRSHAWCYTTDAKTEWEYCDVDCLAPNPKLLVIEPQCGDPKQTDYRGTVSVTKSGKTCQRWDAQTPHVHKNTPVLKPSSGLVDNNYCRNPDGAEKAWCYTTDSKVRWEFCDIDCTTPVHPAEKHDIPRLPLSHCLDARQIDYRGTVSQTKNGRECQRWDVQTPHRHTNTPALKPKAGLDGGHNYCRNPDNSVNGTWCYTTDPKVRWEYCDVDCVAAEEGRVPTTSPPLPLPLPPLPPLPSLNDLFPTNITFPPVPHLPSLNDLVPTNITFHVNLTELYEEEMRESLEYFLLHLQSQIGEAMDHYHHTCKVFAEAKNEKVKAERMKKMMASVKQIGSLMSFVDDLKESLHLESAMMKKFSQLVNKFKNEIKQDEHKKQEEMNDWKNHVKSSLDKLENLDDKSCNDLKQESKIVNVDLDKVIKYLKDLAEKQPKKFRRVGCTLLTEFPQAAKLLKYFVPNLFELQPLCAVVHPSFIQTVDSSPVSSDSNTILISMDKKRKKIRHVKPQ